MDKQVENYIEFALEECTSITGVQPSERYLTLYGAFPSARVQLLFSAVHDALNSCLKSLNSCLPTGEKEGYYWAEPSRTLIALIQLSRDVQSNLKGSECSCSIAEHYERALELCTSFLSQTRGSAIPPHTDSISLYYAIPIFEADESVTISVGGQYHRYQLKLIGEGSYAKVFRYRDDFYGKHFVVKRAKPDLGEKALARFKREYEVMHQLSSPYVLEVYHYDDNAHEYVMENMDCTLEEHLKHNGNMLSIKARKGLALQFLRGMSCLHSHNILHRDISPRNALVRCYEDVTVLKLSDFGQVKLEESMLTSSDTAFKGSFNDPTLHAQGFSTYGMQHEIYAMTRMLYYILTGKTNASGERNEALHNFLNRGTHPDVSKRYKNIPELHRALLAAIDSMTM